MIAASPVAPSVPDGGPNGSVHGHAVNMNLPRLHPIAMNSAPPASDPLIQNFRRYAPAPSQDHGPTLPPPPPAQQPAQPPNPSPSHLDRIESRLRQLEHEEAARTLARSHQLAVRKREDEDFRKVTENAELEEEVCNCICRIISHLLYMHFFFKKKNYY